MAAKLTCAVDVCDNEISPGTGSKGGLPICTRCRAMQYKVAKLATEEIQERRDRWQYWEHRMDYLHPRVAAMLKDAHRKVATAKRLASSSRH
jgi:hypothetical protein